MASSTHCMQSQSQSVRDTLRPLKTGAQLVWRANVVKAPPRELGRWLCAELQQLGPTYVKLGQFVSSRKDLFDAELVAELGALRDRVQPMAPEEVQEALRGVDAAKLAVDPSPIASASIGQAHRATLKSSNKDGRRAVVIKLRRPKVADQIKRDIALWRQALNLMALSTATNNVQDAVDIIDDFEQAVLWETDFHREARSLQAFHDAYVHNPNVIIPRVYPSLSTRDALVMEYVHAIPLAQYAGDRKELARRIMTTFVSQLTTTGTVHGDPHAGNLQVTPAGKLVLYDFGNVVAITQQERQQMKELLYYLMANNPRAVVGSLKKLKVQVSDEAQLIGYINTYMQYLRTLDVAGFKALLASADAAGNSNAKLPFKLTGQLFHLVRAFGILEGICKELDPEFDYFGVLQEHVMREVLDHDFLVYKSMDDVNTLLQSFQQPQTLLPAQPQSQLSSQPLSQQQPQAVTPVMWVQLGLLALLLLKL